MTTRNFDSKKAGSRESNEPRLLGSIIKEMLQSDSLLAKGYRQYIASLENGEAGKKDWNRNTDCCMNVKTFLYGDKRTKVGKNYVGMLKRDSAIHYTFVEMPLQATRKRNPRVFDGEFITVTIWDDGSLHPNFKVMKVDEGFSIGSYALGVCIELREALNSLLEDDK